MTSSNERPSATIYQFPLHLRGRRNAERMSPVRPGNSDSVPQPVASGGGWYHEEAIRDAEHSKKR